MRRNSRLTYIDPFDTCKVFSVLYAFCGFIGLFVAYLLGADSIKLPLGFNIGVCAFTLNFSYDNLHSNAFWFIWVLVVNVVICAVSGAITGGILALGFNLVGTGSPIIVKADAEPLNKPAPVPFDI